MKTEDEIINAKCEEQDAEVARVIYENIFQRDARRYRDWTTALYQAPETDEGFAQRVCFNVAAQIREMNSSGIEPSA